MGRGCIISPRWTFVEERNPLTARMWLRHPPSRRAAVNRTEPPRIASGKERPRECMMNREFNPARVLLAW